MANNSIAVQRQNSVASLHRYEQAKSMAAAKALASAASRLVVHKETAVQREESAEHRREVEQSVSSFERFESAKAEGPHENR